MIHGKAKERFRKFLNTHEEYNTLDCRFEKLPLVCQQALVVEWLLTMNVVADVAPFFDGDEKALTSVKWMPNPIILPITNESEVFEFEYESDKSVSTAKAIEKCINLLNERL